MSQEFGTISKQTVRLFETVRAAGNDTRKRFNAAFQRALSDIKPEWKDNPKWIPHAFEIARRQAQAIICGGEGGWTSHQFNMHCAIIKNSLIFNVPIELAAQTNARELRQAREIVAEQMKRTPLPYPKKMERALRLIHADVESEREQIRREVSGVDPEGWILRSLNYLRASAIQEYIENGGPASATLANVLKTLEAYEKRMEQKPLALVS